MAVKITDAWKAKSKEEKFREAMPDQLLITEVNPEEPEDEKE